MDEYDRRSELEREYGETVAALSDPDVAHDRARFTALSRRHKELETLLHAMRAVDAAREDVEVARSLFDEAPTEERELGRGEVASAEATLESAEAVLREVLLPHDPNDGRNVIVTVRGAEGGEEANLFARTLLDMYLHYAERSGLRTEILEVDASDLHGVNEATIVVKGADAWQRLKFEGGPHRVQRVPVTESQGRIHTSSAVVTVLPEADEIEVEIDQNELRIDVYRSTGPGGQSVNTTDSAVRITHLPTGLVVSMQDEKSQIQNRAKAMLVLRSRLLKLEQDRQAEELSRERREQVKSGGRSEKIRTYNYKENRVTDHRIGLTLYKLDKILDGDLDELVEALVVDERNRRLAQAG